MDKNINEFDRLKIGVREWAIREAMHFAKSLKDESRYGVILCPATEEDDLTWKDIILGAAQEFEKFVLKEVGS